MAMNKKIKLFLNGEKKRFLILFVKTNYGINKNVLIFIYCLKLNCFSYYYDSSVLFLGKINGMSCVFYIVLVLILGLIWFLVFPLFEMFLDGFWMVFSFSFFNYFCFFFLCFGKRKRKRKKRKRRTWRKEEGKKGEKGKRRSQEKMIGGVWGLN